MRAAVARYHAAGLVAVERSSLAAQDRIGIAAQQLPSFTTDPVSHSTTGHDEVNVSV